MRPHFSIHATNPRHVAEVLVELGDGAVMNSGLYPDCFVAVLGDGAGTVVEVFPIHTMVVPPGAQAQATGDRTPVSSSLGAIYGPISITCSADEVYAVAQREGWRVTSQAHNSEKVLAMWIENQVLLELITPKMKAAFDGTSL